MKAGIAKQEMKLTEAAGKKTACLLKLILLFCLAAWGTAQTAEAAAGPFMIAHRGYNAVAPENTLAAFREAGKAGFWGIETDVRETSDGVLVCSHENSLSAETDGKGYINKRKYSYIKKLKVIRGNGRKKYPKERIPRLAEFLKVCKQYGCVAVLDLKYSSVAAVERAYRLVKKMDMLDQAVFQSSVKVYLQAIRKLDRKARLWYLASSISSKVIRTAQSLKCQCINLESISRSAIKKAHNKHLKVCCWRSFNKTTNKRYKKYGIDYIMEDSLL